MNHPLQQIRREQALPRLRVELQSPGVPFTMHWPSVLFRRFRMRHQKLTQ
jgi:hypothetical protein